MTWNIIEHCRTTIKLVMNELQHEPIDNLSRVSKEWEKVVQEKYKELANSFIRAGLLKNVSFLDPENDYYIREDNNKKRIRVINKGITREEKIVRSIFEAIIKNKYMPEERKQYTWFNLNTIILENKYSSLFKCELIKLNENILNIAQSLDKNTLILAKENSKKYEQVFKEIAIRINSNTEDGNSLNIKEDKSFRDFVKARNKKGLFNRIQEWLNRNEVGLPGFAKILAQTDVNFWSEENFEDFKKKYRNIFSNLRLSDNETIDNFEQFKKWFENYQDNIHLLPRIVCFECFKEWTQPLGEWIEDYQKKIYELSKTSENFNGQNICSIKKNLKKIKRGLAHLSTLKIEGNNKNDQKSLSIIPEELHYFKNLQILKIKHFSCNFSLTNIYDITKLPSLKKIKFTRVKIDSFPEVFEDLTQLTTLILDRVNLVEPETLSSFSQLKKLSFKGDNHEEMPQSIAELTSLTSLSLKRVSISDLSILNDLTNLKKLSLTENELEGYLSDLANKNNLEFLKIKKNELKEIPAEIIKIKNLQVLEINNNLFNQFPINIINLLSLKVLNLRCNSLSVIPSEIKQLMYLEELDLSSNKIEKFPQSLIALKSLKILNLHSNPLDLSYLVNTEDSLNTSLFNIETRLPKLEFLSFNDGKFKIYRKNYRRQYVLAKDSTGSTMHLKLQKVN